MNQQQIYLQKAQEYAVSRGGKLLSITYDKNTKLLWKCSNFKHKPWLALYGIVIARRSWCRECYLDKLRTWSVERAQKLANERGGIFLSDEVINSTNKRKWQCNNNHIWEASPKSINGGGWCPFCSEGLAERICRVYLEELFSSEFSKAKPSWLINDDGNKMELDGFCEKLQIAFEHNGLQHYVYNSFFKSNLEKRKNDDQKKIELCSNNKIRLIIIPSLFRILKYKNLQDHIKNECQRLGIEVDNSSFADISILRAYHKKEINYLEDTKRIIEAKGGKLLTDIYPGSKGELIVKCYNGHTWKTHRNRLLDNKWCQECAGKKKRNLAWLTELAEKNDGKSLATKYINNATKVKWKCKKGHQWYAAPHTISTQNQWCPQCYAEKIKKR